EAAEETFLLVTSDFAMGVASLFRGAAEVRSREIESCQIRIRRVMTGKRRFHSLSKPTITDGRFRSPIPCTPN
ncbi:MAG: hypothetical protein J0I81_10815, partial [Hyphomicrobium sp.]|nr:hypothetical protein [Hyphomicrobium sp.]